MSLRHWPWLAHGVGREGEGGYWRWIDERVYNRGPLKYVSFCATVNSRRCSLAACSSSKAALFLFLILLGPVYSPSPSSPSNKNTQRRIQCQCQYMHHSPPLFGRPPLFTYLCLSAVYRLQLPFQSIREAIPNADADAGGEEECTLN